MKTPLTQEIDRLTKINAELVAALQSICDASADSNQARFAKAVTKAHAALAKAASPKPCTRACDSCACHEGVVL